MRSWFCTLEPLNSGHPSNPYNRWIRERCCDCHWWSCSSTASREIEVITTTLRAMRLKGDESFSLQHHLQSCINPVVQVGYIVYVDCVHSSVDCILSCMSVLHRILPFWGSIYWEDAQCDWQAQLCCNSVQLWSEQLTLFPLAPQLLVFVTNGYAWTFPIFLLSNHCIIGFPGFILWGLTCVLDYHMNHTT